MHILSQEIRSVRINVVQILFVITEAVFVRLGIIRIKRTFVLVSHMCRIFFRK